MRAAGAAEVVEPWAEVPVVWGAGPWGSAAGRLMGAAAVVLPWATAPPLARGGEGTDGPKGLTAGDGGAGVAGDTEGATSFPALMVGVAPAAAPCCRDALVAGLTAGAGDAGVAGLEAGATEGATGFPALVVGVAPAAALSAGGRGELSNFSMAGAQH